MKRRTFHALSLAAAVLVLAAFPVAQQPAATGQPLQHQHPAADKTQQKPDMAATCQEMMKQHEKMMADQKAADQRLDGLVAKMNAASGQAKVDATAATVSEIVSQRRVMHESMMKMHHGAMMHMSEHMQGGKDSMAMCPMMKMGSMKH